MNARISISIDHRSRDRVSGRLPGKPGVARKRGVAALTAALVVIGLSGCGQAPDPGAIALNELQNTVLSVTEAAAASDYAAALEHLQALNAQLELAKKDGSVPAARIAKIEANIAVVKADLEKAIGTPNKETPSPSPTPTQTEETTPEPPPVETPKPEPSSEPEPEPEPEPSQEPSTPPPPPKPSPKPSEKPSPSPSEPEPSEEPSTPPEPSQTPAP